METEDIRNIPSQDFLDIKTEFRKTGTLPNGPTLRSIVQVAEETLGQERNPLTKFKIEGTVKYVKALLELASLGGEGHEGPVDVPDFDTLISFLKCIARCLESHEVARLFITHPDDPFSNQEHERNYFKTVIDFARNLRSFTNWRDCFWSHENAESTIVYLRSYSYEEDFLKLVEKAEKKDLKLRQLFAFLRVSGAQFALDPCPVLLTVQQEGYREDIVPPAGAKATVYYNSDRGILRADLDRSEEVPDFLREKGHCYSSTKPYFATMPATVEFVGASVPSLLSLRNFLPVIPISPDVSLILRQKQIEERLILARCNCACTFRIGKVLSKLGEAGYRIIVNHIKICLVRPDNTPVKNGFGGDNSWFGDGFPEWQWILYDIAVKELERISCPSSCK